MLKMQFCNPVFQPGLNMTVRAGSKWAEFKVINDIGVGLTIPGAPILLEGKETQGKPREAEFVVSTYPVGQGLLIGASEFDTLKDIPLDLLAFNHDPNCRDHEGLQAAIDAHYGDHCRDGYTVVFFWADYR